MPPHPLPTFRSGSNRLPPCGSRGCRCSSDRPKRNCSSSTGAQQTWSRRPRPCRSMFHRPAPPHRLRTPQREHPVPEPITTSTAALRAHSFRAMASQVTVQLVGVEVDEAAAAADRVEHLFGEIESACTRFDPCSPLMTANAAPRSWHHVPDSCFAAIHEAHQAYRSTGGLFDPRVLRSLLASGYDSSLPFATGNVQVDGRGPGSVHPCASAMAAEIRRPSRPGPFRAGADRPGWHRQGVGRSLGHEHARGLRGGRHGRGRRGSGNPGNRPGGHGMARGRGGSTGSGRSRTAPTRCGAGRLGPCGGDLVDQVTNMAGSRTGCPSPDRPTHRPPGDNRPGVGHGHPCRPRLGRNLEQGSLRRGCRGHRSPCRCQGTRRGLGRELGSGPGQPGSRRPRPVAGRPCRLLISSGRPVGSPG